MATMTSNKAFVFGQGEQGWDATTLQFFDAQTGGTLLLSVRFTSDPSPLAEGEGYIIPNGNLIYTQPEASGEDGELGVRKLKGIFSGEVWLGLAEGASDVTPTAIANQNRVQILEENFTFTSS